VFPLAEFGGWFGIRVVKRWLDRGFRSDKNKSKKKTIQQYVNLYSGPSYFIHSKYASILMMCFVVMMYGPGIPLLYFIALLAFLVLYVLDRILLAYYYEQPPTLDDKLTKSTLTFLKWPLLLYFFFGYWMLSNKQMFHNEVHPKEKFMNVDITGHYLFSNF
jgi:hypothetical protein